MAKQFFNTGGVDLNLLAQLAVMEEKNKAYQAQKSARLGQAIVGGATQLGQGMLTAQEQQRQSEAMAAKQASDREYDIQKFAAKEGGPGQYTIGAGNQAQTITKPEEPGKLPTPQYRIKDEGQGKYGEYFLQVNPNTKQVNEVRVRDVPADEARKKTTGSALDGIDTARWGDDEKSAWQAIMGSKKKIPTGTDAFGFTTYETTWEPGFLQQMAQNAKRQGMGNIYRALSIFDNKAINPITKKPRTY